MCQQSAETRQVVDYITLYQSVVRGINSPDSVCL